MALNAFDTAKHHIGLGAAGGTMFGFMVDGSYRMEGQREAVGAPDFGGATDLIGQAPSMARWTQDDFTGGCFQWNWGRDDAMFADSLNFMPDAQGRSLLSCPPLFLKKAIDPDTQAGWVSDVPKAMFMVGGSIYVVFGHAIARYEIGTDTLTWKLALTNSTYVWAGYEPNDQLIWAICNTSVGGDRPFMERITTALGAPSFDATMIGPATTADLKAYGATIRDQNILVQIGRKLWIGDPPDRPDPIANGIITWTKVGRLPGRWKDAISYSGMTYILTNDGQDSPTFESQLVAFDGDAILPICQFPHNFYGKKMIEYGGRIFVGGTGTDVNGGEHYAELYEVTGASVRLVRSFSPETRRQLLSSGDWPNAINSLAAFEGLLWMPQKGKRMVAYDITSDGFFGAAEIQSNTDLDFRAMVHGRGRLWAFGVDDTDDTKHGIYRIAQPADSIAAWNPTFVTSDFAYEPGMKKRWSEIKVMTRYAACTSIEYSIDGGATWTGLSVTVTSSGTIYYSSAPLQAIDPIEHIRFRIKLDSTSPTDAKTYHRELVAYTVSFAMLDTGKRAWAFTLAGADEIETLDAELDEGVTQTQDTTTMASTLWGWHRDKTRLVFTDVDDSTANVQLVGFIKSMPQIDVPDSGETHPEAHFILTLQEV